MLVELASKNDLDLIFHDGMAFKYWLYSSNKEDYSTFIFSSWISFIKLQLSNKLCILRFQMYIGMKA